MRDETRIGRRHFMRLASRATVAAGIAGVVPTVARAQGRAIKIGYVSPPTGPLAEIATFKREKVDIVTGVPIPPDWTTFWKQAAQQGFRPKVASVGKALLFPRSVEALGEVGDGMSTEVWWTPQHPFKSSLTGATAAAFAAEYTKETKKQWTQPQRRVQRPG